MEISRVIFLPLALMEDSGGFKILSESEELGIVLYVAENERKRGLFRRKAELIETISLIYYPIIPVKFMNELVLLFNPFSNDEAVFEYIESDHEHIEKLFNEAAISRNEAFLFKLTEITSVFKDIIDGKAFYKVVRCRAEGLVTDGKLLEELRTLLHRHIDKKREFVKLEPKHVDYENYSKSLEEALMNQAKEKAYLLNIESRIKKLVDKWIDDLKEKYGSELKSIDEEIKVVRDEVEAKIDEYRRSKEEKERDVREKYLQELKQLENKLKSLRDNMDNLELELSKTKRTGGDVELIKRKIKNTESQIKDLERRKKDLENSMKEELDEIRLRYDELINREELKLRNLEGRKESINREFESYVKQAEEKMRVLTDVIHGLIAKLKEFEKSVLNIGIPFTINSKTVCYVPICMVTYLSGGRRRTDYITPLKVKRGFRGLIKEYFRETRRFLINSVAKSSASIDYSKIINENNIMNKITPNEVEVALATLIDLGLIGKKDAGRVVQSYQNLLSTKR